MKFEPKPQAVAKVAEDKLEPFFQSLLASNPFASNRITDPSQLQADVPAIHESEFAALVRLAQISLETTDHGVGALLLGGAGNGKSHLLARFASWAAEHSNGFERACFVFLHNIQVAPDDLGRYLLKCFVSKLIGHNFKRWENTPLFRIVNFAICSAADAEKIKTVNGNNRRQVSERLEARFRGEDPLADNQIFEVIFRFFESVTRAKVARDAGKMEKAASYDRAAGIAVRWLRGELLDADEAKEIGQLLKPGQEVTELAQHQITGVFVTICRLARVSNRPMILCIDQTDNLSTEQLQRLTKDLHALLDVVNNNLLVILSGVEQTMLKRISDGDFSESALDRFNANQPIKVSRIKRSAAQKLIEMRLQAFFSGHKIEDIPELSKMVFADPLFPLGKKWFENLHPDAIEYRPRDVVSWANLRWIAMVDTLRKKGGRGWFKHWQELIIDLPKLTREQLIDQKVAEKIEEEVNSKLLQPESLPPDAGNMVGLTSHLLRQCVKRPGNEYSLVDFQLWGKQRPDMEVVEAANGIKIRNHVQFVVTKSKVSAAGQLRKLLDSKGADRRVLVTDSSRCPLELGQRGQEYLDKLTQQAPYTFDRVDLSFADYAALHALASVEGDANAGDIEIPTFDGPAIRVTAEDVIQSNHRADRYRSHPLLRHFLTEEPIKAPPPCEINDDVFRKFVCERLSVLTGASLSELRRQFFAREKIKGRTADEASCATRCRDIVLRMHEDEVVSAKPHNDDLYLIYL